jgi:type IV pilus assembly protein PilN
MARKVVEFNLTVFIKRPRDKDLPADGPKGLPHPPGAPLHPSSGLPPAHA